jgi:hypothetical protein
MRTRSPRPRLKARCRFSQGIFAGTWGNGRDAPIPVVRGAIVEPLKSTHKSHSWPRQRRWVDQEAVIRAKLPVTLKTGSRQLVEQRLRFLEVGVSKPSVNQLYTGASRTRLVAARATSSRIGAGLRPGCAFTAEVTSAVTVIP